MALRLKLALFAFCASCGVDQAAPTQVVVVVGSDLPLAKIEATVAKKNGRDGVLGAYELGSGAGLPTSFTIVPADDPADVFRVSVVGYLASGDVEVPVVRAIALGRFSAGQTVLLPMALSSECRTRDASFGDFCDCAWERDGCERTCAPRGYGENKADCHAVPDYLVLPTVTPGQEVLELDEGTSACDPGEVPSPDGSCVDLNECAFGLDTCDQSPAACVNVLGGQERFTCRCPEGSQGNGVGTDGCVPSG